MDSERKLLNAELESLDLRKKEIDSKTLHISKLNNELDDNKKSLNVYYETRIKELEDKLKIINTEKDKVELRLKEAKQVEIRERELEIKERDIDEKLETIQAEFVKLNKLKEENLQIKGEIDSKIVSYRNVIASENNRDRNTAREITSDTKTNST